jgi:hypothetical protein
MGPPGKRPPKIENELILKAPVVWRDGGKAERLVD